MAGKMRSPNYPALSLVQALEAADKLWKAEKRTAVSHETAALAMGYKALSGPARVAIAALRQYGLIDKAEKGHVQISDLAVAILHGHGTEREIALGQAGLSPSLFLELSRTHLEASETAIRSHLITKKQFAEDGARRAAKAFKDTVAFAIQGKKGYTPAEGAGEPEAMQGTETGQNISGGGKSADGVLALTVPYAKGTIGVQIRVSGEPISARHLAAVGRYLKLTEHDLIEWPEGDLPDQSPRDRDNDDQ
jgi:hypothetical protein